MSYLTATRSPSFLGSYGRGSRSPSLLGSYGPRGGSPSFLGALRRRRRGMRGMGDDSTTYDMSQTITDPQAYAVATLPGAQLPLDSEYWNDATLSTLAANTPVSPGSLTQGPVPQSLQNLLTNMSPPTDPLSYISPQAAIAAGMDPTTVYNAWAQSMAQFPTQQAALNAGVPAGVVTQLWGQSRSYVQPAAAPSWWAGTTLGVSNTTLALGGGVALMLFAFSSGRHKR
jgi:hypothetical protein